MNRVGIVGANIAGLGAARGLREAGYEGQILILDRDAEALVDRPSLSKAVLIEGSDPPVLAGADEIEKLNLELVHEHVQSIDGAARTINAESGRSYPCDSIVLCTGADPIVPEFIANLGLDRFFLLRSAADARRLYSALSPGRHVVVLGGGLIGMEVAAAARMRNVEVTVVEAQPVPMMRAFGKDCGRQMAIVHSDRGVRLRMSSRVRNVARSDAGVLVELESGERIEADLIIAALGVRPATGLAEAAGIAVDDGVLVDSTGRTSRAGIYAAGDVARYAARGGFIRSENLLHGHRHGLCVGRAVGGAPAPYDEIQSYWSDQFGISVQACGSIGVGMVISRQVAGQCRTYWHDGTNLTGAVMVDGGADMAAARRLIERQIPISPEDLVRGTSLRSLLRASAI